jgi:hypothetical protein
MYSNLEIFLESSTTKRGKAYWPITRFTHQSFFINHKWVEIACRVIFLCWTGRRSILFITLFQAIRLVVLFFLDSLISWSIFFKLLNNAVIPVNTIKDPSVVIRQDLTYHIRWQCTSINVCGCSHDQWGRFKRRASNE